MIRSYHNKIKHSKDISDSYSLICSNIKKLLDNISDCDITIRFNYTVKNLSLDVASDLIDSFEEKYRARLEFLPRQVWQEDESKIDESLLNSVVDEIQRGGFKINKTIDMELAQCYAESDKFFTIFHNGKVDKCGNLSLDEANGELSDEGSILWMRPLSTVYKNIWELNSPCTQCKYFPICMGPCLLKRKFALESGQAMKCLYNAPDQYFSQLIIDYVESFR